MHQVVNSEGTWVQLDKNSVVEFCESDEGEAWSLARDRGGNQYLRHDDGKPRLVTCEFFWKTIKQQKLEFKCVFAEQALLEHGNQTPPPSPFSVQAFNRATTSNGAQGFDYGISNNKGNCNLEFYRIPSLCYSVSTGNCLSSSIFCLPGFCVYRL